jgi:hypothetical protein
MGKANAAMDTLRHAAAMLRARTQHENLMLQHENLMLRHQSE